MKQIFFQIFRLYTIHFPINKGKYFLSALLTKLLGSFSVQNFEMIYLEVFLNSSMDMSCFDRENESHNIIKEQILSLPNGGVFVDIGANIGYFSFLASKKVGPNGRIYAFEPSHREYKRLLTNLHKNKSLNLIPYNVALGSHNGFVEMDIALNHTGLNSVSKDYNNSFNKIVSPIFTLDSLIGDSVGKISLIKLDVEGLEYKVLKGMKHLLEQKKIERLVVEITDTFLNQYGDSKSDIYSFLGKFGYKAKYNYKGKEWQYDEVFEIFN